MRTLLLLLAGPLSSDAAAQMVIPVPTQMQAYDYASTKIALFWKDNSRNETGFKIERKTELAGAYAQIATVGVNVTTYRDTGLITGTNYHYRVRATSGSVDSPYSNEARAKPRLPRPLAPSKLKATAVSSSTVDLVWKDNAALEAGFKIEHKAALADPYEQVGVVGVGITNYQDTGLVADTRYFYRVQATNSAGVSLVYAAATAKTDVANPPPPTAPANLALQPGSTSEIALSWKDKSANETGFEVERKPVLSGSYAQIGTVGAGITNYQDTGLSAETGYAYRVRASGATGDSDYSTEAAAMTAGTPVSGFLGGGGTFSVALKSDTTVWTWGTNRFGMGDGTNLPRSTPVQVAGLNNVAAVATGRGAHAFALKSDGTVWGWGGNHQGQLGDGTTNSRSSPVQITSLATDVSQLAAGAGHSVALKTDGTVWVWGGNTYGLGDGATTMTNAPMQLVSFGNNGLKVAAGGSHTVVLDGTGTVWCWGKNAFGQLGNGSITNRNLPVQTSGLANVIDVAAGNDFTLALKSDGTVWSWGANAAGQLGDGSVVARFTPVRASQLGSNVVQIAAGGAHGAALKTDGTVWTWGGNTYGQLGDGTTTLRSTPIQASKLTGVVSIGIGSDHTLATTGDGSVWAWGKNRSFEMGNGSNSSTRIPTVMTNFTRF